MEAGILTDKNNNEEITPAKRSDYARAMRIIAEHIEKGEPVSPDQKQEIRRLIQLFNSCIEQRMCLTELLRSEDSGDANGGLNHH